jgi:hypothetical protein
VQSPIRRIERIDGRIALLRDEIRTLMIERGGEVRGMVGTRHGGMAQAARDLGVSQTQLTRILADDTVRRVDTILSAHGLDGWCAVVAGRGAAASVTLRHSKDGRGIHPDVLRTRAEVVVFHLREAGFRLEAPDPRLDAAGGLDAVLASLAGLRVTVPPVEG